MGRDTSGFWTSSAAKVTFDRQRYSLLGSSNDSRDMSEMWY